MKTFVLLAALLFVGAVSAQPYPAYTPGRRIKSRDAKPISELCLGGRKRVCNEDNCAKGFVQCTGTGKGIDYDCGGEVPYCGLDSEGQAKCISERPSTCGVDQSENQCMAAGVFPDFSDCKKYFVCTSDGADDFYPADDFECDELYNFNPTGRNNDYCQFRGRCVTPNCQGSTKNIIVNYSGFRGQIVATCRKDKKPIATRCEEGFLADLNTIPVECKVRCARRDAKYEFPGNKWKYYECIIERGRLVAKERTCFRNMSFDKVKKYCVPDSNPTPYPTTAGPTTTGGADLTTAGGDSTTNAAGSTTKAGDSTTNAGDSTTVIGTTNGSGESSSDDGSTVSIQSTTDDASSISPESSTDSASSITPEPSTDGESSITPESTPAAGGG